MHSQNPENSMQEGLPVAKIADDEEKESIRDNIGIATMIIGILSCLFAFVGLIACVFNIFLGILVAFFSLTLGVIALIFGHIDLKGIKAKSVSDEGYGMVVAGYVLGIVGVSVSGLIVAATAIFFLFMFFCFGLLFLNMAGRLTPVCLSYIIFASSISTQ